MCSKREIVGCEAKRPPLIGSRPQQQFVDRFVGEPVGIIAVGMATGDREDALGEQIADAMRQPRRDASVGHRGRQRGQQAESSIGRFQ